MNDLYHFCPSCSSSNHFIYECGYLHHIPDVDFILKRHIFNENQKRINLFKRRIRRSHNALKNHFYILENASKFSFLSFSETEDEIDEFSPKDKKNHIELKKNENIDIVEKTISQHPTKDKLLLADTDYFLNQNSSKNEDLFSFRDQTPPSDNLTIIHQKSNKKLNSPKIRNAPRVFFFFFFITIFLEN